MRIKNPKQPKELGKQGDINKPEDNKVFNDIKKVTDHFVSSNEHLFLNKGTLSSNFAHKKNGFKINENGSFEANNANIYKGRVGANLIAIDPGDDVQGAVNAVDKLGGGTVHFSPGTYNLTSDLVLPSNIILEGQSPQNTIISFGSNNAQIKVHGSNLYEVGTVSITKGTQTVTGSGTAWLSNVSVGQYIRLGDANWFQITAVNSDTELTIYNLFFGDDQSGASYKIASIKENVSINHMAVIQSATDGISYYLTNNTKMYNVFSMYHGGRGIKANVSDWNILNYIILAFNTLQGLYINDANNNVLNKFYLIQNNNGGFYLTKANLSSYENIRSDGNLGNGIEIENCINLHFYSCGTLNNSNNGFFVNTSDYITISNESKNNDNTGSYILDSSNIILQRSLIINNQNEGIKLESSNNNALTDNILKNNSQAGSGNYDEVLITDDGSNYSTYNVISSNNINTTNGNYGIKENASGDDYNNIHGNTVQGAVTANISTAGTNTETNDNLDGSSSSTSASANYTRFGDGSDGDVTISLNTTLTSDKNYNNLTINSGVTLNTAGYVVRVKGILTVDGTIARNGNDGNIGEDGTTFQTGGGGGAGGTGLVTNTIFGSLTGAAGGDATGFNDPGAPGSNGSDADPSISGVNGVSGGNGADGGDKSGGTGGTGGIATQENYRFYYPLGVGINNLNQEITTLENILQVLKIEGVTSGVTLSNAAASGGGGGGGCEDNKQGGGGGGAGSGGGIVLIYSANIVINSGGKIEAIGGNGGNGGNGLAGVTPAGGGGGGGGGTGGLIILIYGTINNNGILDVSGGMGGIGGNTDGAVQDGYDGNNGNLGKYIQIKV